MKIHYLIVLAIALLLAGCVNFEHNAEFPDAGNEATQEETAEAELGTKIPAPSPAAIPPPSPSPKPPAAQSTATPQAATPPPEPETPAPAETINPPPKSEPAPNLLATPEEGVLVKAPQNYTTKASKDTPTYGSPTAQIVFVSPENHEYTVRVFRRRPGETLLDWGKRGSFGDAFLPVETIRTRDGNSGYVYETNDLGALPDHHITLMTEGFVYRFDWDNPRLDWNDPAETLMALIRGREQEFFPVPEHFKAFVRNVELK